MLIACLGPDLSLGALTDALEETGATTLPGFGAAWYAPDDLPVAYAQPLPAAFDDNLAALGRALYADCWLVQCGNGTRLNAPQPLLSEELACVIEFEAEDWPILRVALRDYLDEETEAALDYTDAASGVFAMLQDILGDDEELALDEALAELCRELDEMLDGMPATLVCAVTDGDQVWALRRSWQDEAPPLHWCADTELFDGAFTVCGEPLDDGLWQLLPENQVLVIDREAPPELIPL